MTAFAYVNAAPTAFVHDDAVFAQLARQPSWSRVVDLFSQDTWAVVGQPPSGLYRPLSMSTIVAEGFLHGGDPRALHATVIALHVAVTLMLFGFLRALLRELLARRGDLDERTILVAALVAAAIFGVHPIHTDAVDSFYNRSELFVALGNCAAFWLVWSWSSRRPVVAWGGAALIYFATLLCKESAASMPLLLVMLLGLLRPDGTPRERLRRLAPVLVLAVPLIIYGVLRARAVPWPAWAPSRFELYHTSESWGMRLAKVTSTLADALRLLVWPHPLRCNYDAFVPHDLVFATALHLALVGAAISSVRRRPVVTVGIASFYVGVLPSTPLLQDFSPLPGVFAERFLYSPSAALTIPLAFGLARAVARWQWRPVAAASAFACVVLTSLTHARNEDWHSEVLLFEAEYRLDRGNGRSAWFLCGTYLNVGRVADATRLCDDFLRENPTCDIVLSACTVAYRRFGRTEDAVATIQRNWDIHQDPHVGMEVGRLQIGWGERAAAEDTFLRAVDLTRNPVNRHVRRGEMILRLHPERVGDARREFEAALALDPSSSAVRDWLRRAQR